MLITKTILITNKRSINYFFNKGIFNKTNNTLELDISYLSPTSKEQVKVKCDICGVEKIISYVSYIRNIANYNIYTCNSKCALLKNKMTSLKKYGSEHYSKTNESKEKIKQTNIEKYGVENVFQNEEIKEKIKQTNIEKYGVEHYSKTYDFKIKVKETNLEKYGVEYGLQNKTIREKIKQTNLDKYGVENVFQNEEIKEKSKETNINKYGVEYFSKSDEFLEKVRKTNLEKYDVEFVSQNQIFKDKIKETNLEKYGVICTLHNTEVKKKVKETNLEKYGVENYAKSEISKINTIIGQHPNYIKYLDNSISLIKCDLNKDHEFEIKSDNFLSRLKLNIPLCTICYPIGDNKSIKEKILLEYIQSIYSGEIISGYRDGIEIDIYLPDIKLGLEFNGLYWHSNKFIENDYHLNKKEFFKQKEIDVKFIWEDDFDNNFDIIKSQINNWLGLSNKIYARKTYAKEIINKEEYRNFLNNNHIQGFVPSKLVYGLYCEYTLVSLMCFDKKEGRLNMKEGEWNLTRFCNLLNHQVIGGASKLLNHFIKENNPKRVISYADKDWSNGNLYNILGFNLVNESKPDYKYIVDGLRKSKQNFTKSKLEKLGHDISLTESQIMSNLGINKIYDCGKMKFEKIIK